jgi:hypothetical protein
MRKLLSYIKKTIKAILWVLVVFVLIFLIVAGVIQIPAVQNKIVNYATTFVSNKTHTKVQIKNLSISFPKAVLIEGLYLEDMQKDTLIYAKKAIVNIVLKDLLFNKICINNIELTDMHLNLHNSKNDSLFNYNFLIKAFTDTTQQKLDDSKASKPWTFTLDNVNLENIRIRYFDNFGGMKIFAMLDKLDLSIDEIDMKKSIYKIDDLLVEKLKTSIQIEKSNKTEVESTNVTLPKITANNIQINNSSITFSDLTDDLLITAKINRLDFKKGEVDLRDEIVNFNKVYLSESDVRYYKKGLQTIIDSTIISKESIGNKWKVSVDVIDFDNNSVQYHTNYNILSKKIFDSNHLNFRHINLNASDLYYAWDKTQFSIEHFSAIDQNNFAITGLETEFIMGNQSISAKNIQASTTNSSLQGDLLLNFESLNSLKDSIATLALNLKIRKLILSNADVLYFSPDLTKLDFFKNKQTKSLFSGNVNGKINNLKGKNIIIKTAKNTKLKTDFHIIGLPKVETAFFNFPNLNLISTKDDIKQMAASNIPVSIEIPDEIGVDIAFKGKINDFITTIKMNSSMGKAWIDATIDKDENFNTKLNLENFDLGSLLKNKKMYGPVSMTAQVKGHGLNQKTVKADINANVSEIKLNNYLYHNLLLNGTIANQQFDGKINMNNQHAEFDFAGLVNFNPGKERLKFNLNLKGADLQKLNFTKENMQIAFNATADLKGGTISKLNGIAGISDMIIAKNGKKYMLDSVLVASVNQPQKSEMNFKSALVNLKYNGTISPASLPNALISFMNNYFPFSTSKLKQTNSDASDFNFEIELKNHPILSEVLLPELKEFDPGIIIGSFDSRKKEMKIDANIKHLVYGTTEVDDFLVNLNADSSAMNYKISSASISNSQIKFDNFLFDGKIADNKITANISSVDLLNKKLYIGSVITKQNANYKLALNPKDFYIMDKRWDIAKDNYIEFGKPGFMIHQLYLKNADSEVNIASLNNKFNDDINIYIKNFKLEDISKIVEKDSSLMKGNLDGNVLLKRTNNSYGIVADAAISKLMVRNVPIGNLTLKAGNPSFDKFDIAMNLTGIENNMTANGYFIPNGGNNSIKINTDIQSLSMKTIEAFSMGQITQASGNMSGNLSITGRTDAPEINGEMVFNNAFLNPSYLNNRIELKHETIQLKTDGFYFKSFTLLDEKNNKATIDGSIQMNQFADYRFNLQVNSKNFLLFNTKAAKNQDFYGRMIIDSKVNMTGPMSLPVINANVKMKEGSNFTFVVPEDEYTTNKGENVIVFNDSLKFNPILKSQNINASKNSGFKGFDLAAIIEVDKKATLRLLMDPTSSDSLVVKGEAALSFNMDRAGKMSLTGAYNLNEGSCLVSLESVIKRKFDIVSGSTIIWNGDPLDAEIFIDATYDVRTAPYNLVADQLSVSGLSDVEKGGYKQTYPFQILLKLRGAILQPEISFEIQLLPEDKGILGGAVNQKLSLLNEDPSTLNKQVFALLVLGRFVQENPLQSESSGTSSLIRSTVGNFLSAQLNKLSSKVIPGMEMNFDVQSYDDYQTGEAQGRTQVEIGLKKQLFNERLTVQIGGTIDVEGEKAKQNSVSNITSDVDVEYKLTDDGRYRLKGFRHNQYEGALEGQLIETGVGIVFVRDFNWWNEFFKKPEKIKIEKKK